jgi:hypothetical protein
VTSAQFTGGSPSAAPRLEISMAWLLSSSAVIVAPASYRSRQPLRVVAEIVDWEPHPPEVLQHMRDHLEELDRLGVEAIND